MVILHIACVDDNPVSGVDTVVPQHVVAQAKYADTALWNLKGVQIASLDKTLTGDSLGSLPEPYSKPDIAVFHEVYKPKYIPISKELRRLGIPYVVVPHSSLNRAAQKKSRIKKLPANLLMFRPFCDNAAGIQCLSETEKRESVFGRDLFVATNGFYPPEHTKQSFGESSTRFVFIGRLEPYIKGLDIMIKAFAREKVFLEKNNCRLDIYGPFNHRGERFDDRIRALIDAENAQELIRLHDSVSGDDKRSVLLESDVFVQTSRSDGMPMGVLEALATGLPCVVTQGTTLADAVESFKAGRGVKTDADAVADALKKIVAERSDMKKLSENALRLSREFEWDKVALTAVRQYRKYVNTEN